MRLDVSAAIAAALVAIPSLGCYIGCGKEEPFDEQGTVPAWWVDDAMTLEEDARCERLCTYLLNVDLVELDRCSFELDPDYTPPDTGLADTAVDERGGASVSCSGIGTRICKGRRPVGATSEAPVGEDPLGRTLARYARDERSAVVAFEQLIERLRAWNAPEALVRRCVQAAEEERRHDQLLTPEALARGVAVPAFAVPDAAPERMDLAVNNAVEGCANEATAALVAHLLARHAPTASLRAAFEQIARDETGHAQLSWELHSWFLDQLDPAGRQQLEGALDEALARIPEALASEAACLPPELGLPEGVIVAGHVLRARLAA